MDTLFNTPDADFYLQVRLGLVSGYTPVTINGRNPDIGTASDPEDVWNGGGLYTGQPDAFTPETVEVFSGSAADASGGTGMRTVRFFGLKASTDTAESSEDVTLNGVTGVVTTSTWYRVYRAEGLTYGSGATNAGDITIRASVTTANVFAVMPLGFGHTQIAAFTVPTGKTAHIIGRYVSMGRANGNPGSATISLRVREPGTGGYNAVRTYSITNARGADTPLENPMKGIPAVSDIKVMVDDVSDNNTFATAKIHMIMV